MFTILRYRLVPVLFIAISLTYIGRLFLTQPTLTLNIIPADKSSWTEKPITSFDASKIYMTGQMRLEQPSITQKILFPDADGRDLLTNLAILVVAICFLFISGRFNNDEPFKSNFKPFLTIIGLALVAYFLVNKLRLYVVSNEVLALTRGEFRVSKNPVTATYCLWLGFIFLWIRFLFEKGKGLQEEQQLTI